MIILGVDTSCEQASCAVYNDGVITECKSAVDKRKHSETLMPMVDGLMKETGLTSSDIDLFAVSSGPGSFTGLRIGMAAMKGMAFSLGRQMAMIKTPDVLANSYSKDCGTVCPITDARNNQVYTAVYEWNGDVYSPTTPYVGIRIEELADMLRNHSRVNFCGDASINHFEYFKNEGIRAERPTEEKLYPSAGVLVELAARGYCDMVNPADAVPFYLRVSQAERFHGKK